MSELTKIYERAVFALEEIKEGLDQHTGRSLEDRLYYIDVALNIALLGSLDNDMAVSVFKDDSSEEPKYQLTSLQQINRYAEYTNSLPDIWKCEEETNG